MTEYLTREEDRIQAILNDTNQRFQFQHQDASDILYFQNRTFENRVDINPFALRLLSL